MTDFISPFLANVIGIFGSALILAGYAYANLKANFDRLWFNLINLAGALLLMISLLVHWNLASFLLEIAWSAIAIVGIAAALRNRRKAAL